MENSISILKYFETLTDPRKDINKKHKLIDIVAITICAVICGCEHWEEIQQFGRAKRKWFKSFLELPNGIPSHDRIRYVFAFLDPLEFEQAFQSWVESIRKHVENDIVPIDGKTCCGSFDKKNSVSPVHLVSAWSRHNRLVLGQVRTEEKSNEIDAIPELLKKLAIEGCIVTIDAMGCQKKITKQIIDKDAEYVIAVKENQKTLHQRIKKTFDVLHDSISCRSSADEEKMSHGRSEKREYYLTGVPEHWEEKKEWPGLQSIGMAKSERLVNGEYKQELRYYILSLNEKCIRKFSTAARGHWGIENSLHWQLDVSFKEDACRKRSANAQQNFSLLRKIALALLKSEKSKTFGIKSKSKLAGWDTDYLLKVLFSR